MASPINKIITKIIVSLPDHISDKDDITIELACKTVYVLDKIAQINNENIYTVSCCELNKSCRISIDIISNINQRGPFGVGLWSYDFNRNYINYNSSIDEKTYSTYFGLSKKRGSITIFTFDMITLLLIIKSFLSSNEYPTDLVYPILNIYRSAFIQ